MRLHFDLALVRRLLDHSKAATERSPSSISSTRVGSGATARTPTSTTSTADNFPTADDVDPTKIPPGLWLVGDQGIYLMSQRPATAAGGPGRHPQRHGSCG